MSGSDRRVVCFCSLGPPLTGQAVVSQEALHCFRDAAYQVELIPKRIAPGPAKTWDYLLSLPRLVWRLLGQPRPQFAYLACSRSRAGFLRDALFIVLCRLRHIPVINHVHGNDLPILLRDAALGALARTLLNGLFANILVAPTLAAECSRAGLRNGVVIGNFAAPEFFELSVTRAERDPPVRILYLSNVMQAKGLFDLIEACRRLPRDATPLQLDIVGPVFESSRALEARTRAALQQLARLDFVKWHGPLYGPEKLRAYADADIYCLPSLNEAGPLSLLEAMAAGLPCVATAVGGVPELVVSGENAWVVPPGEPAVLAGRLQPLVASADLRRQVGERARAHARRHFTRGRFRDELDRLVRSLPSMSQPDLLHGGNVPSLRILHVSLWLVEGGGGTQAYLRALLQALSDVPGLQCSAAALHHGAVPAQWPGVVHRGSAGQPVRNLWRLAWYLMRFVRNFDVVHVHGVVHWAFLLAVLACRVRGVPYVASPHGQLARVFLGVRWRRRLTARWAAAPQLRAAHAVVATTDWEAAQISRFVPGATVVTVPPAVIAAEHVRAATSEGDEPLRVLFLGELSRLKGVPVLLEAIARLHAQGRHVRLVVAGAPVEPELDPRNLKDRLRALGIEALVDFPGYLVGEAKWQALARAHVLALPSFTESFSFATAEALGAGVPAVVTTEVGLAPTIERHGCGTVVPPGDPAALAGALAQYADPAFRNEKAARARRCAEREFAVPAMREGLLDLYRSAVRRRLR